MTEDENEKAVESGISAMRREYYTSVRGIARGIVEDLIREGERFDSDALSDRINETVDGNYWVIYTHANLRCMVASDNWTAIEDEDGMGEFSSMSDMTAKAAYFALAADIRDELTRVLDVDLDDPCPECEECGGDGKRGLDQALTCPDCNGKGFTFPVLPTESK